MATIKWLGQRSNKMARLQKSSKHRYPRAPRSGSSFEEREEEDDDVSNTMVTAALIVQRATATPRGSEADDRRQASGQLCEPCVLGNQTHRAQVAIRCETACTAMRRKPHHAVVLPGGFRPRIDEKTCSCLRLRAQRWGFETNLPEGSVAIWLKLLDRAAGTCI